MPDKNDYLDAVVDLRASYKDFVAAVDADLAEERRKRLNSRAGDIRAAVVNAYAHGASLAEIKRAYGTKDHNTIKNMVEGAEREVQVAKGKKPEPVMPTDWFEINGLFQAGNVVLYAEGSGFDVIELEGDEFLLDLIEGEDGTLYDGQVLDSQHVGPAQAVYQALLKVRDER